MFLKFLYIFVGCFALTAADDESQYKKYKVYSLTPTNEDHAEFLHSLQQTDSDDFDFWQYIRRPCQTSHVMVTPEKQKYFEITLRSKHIPYSVLIPDVGKVIEKPDNQEFGIRSFGSRAIGFTQYHSFYEINSWLDSLSKVFPKFVTVQEIGKSFEGRSLKTITISDSTSSEQQRTEKPVIFIDGGIHAREWIAPATALYIIHQLVENNAESNDLLKKFDWIILPVVNPDGYEYTRRKDRLWRKTRKPNNKNCMGTDANRNFGYHWGETGASTNGCSDIYRGPVQFSEPETIALRDLLLSLKGRTKFYLTLHSFGNYLLYPWGWTSSLPSTWKDLDEVARAGATAIKSATGTRYTVGSSTNVLYAASGGSDDWVFAEGGAPISITLELPGGGSSGFNPKPTRISKIVDETWVGIRAMAKKVEEKYAS